MARRDTPPRPLASARWQSPVDTVSDLPSDGNTAGDVREVLDDGDGSAAIYQWGGSSWVKIADPDAAGSTGTVTSVDLGSDSGSTSAITSSGTFTIAGGTNVSTSATGTTVTIASTDQYSGTVTSLGLGSDSGSTSAITSSGTFTIAGTSTEIETSATGTTVTIGLPDDVVIADSLTVSGQAVQQAGLRVKFGQVTAATVTLDNTYHVVDCNTTSNTIAITLPRASTIGSGMVYRIQDFANTISGSGNSITVTCDSNDTTGSGGAAVGGSNTQTISTGGGHIWIVSNGSNGWGILTSNL